MCLTFYRRVGGWAFYWKAFLFGMNPVENIGYTRKYGCKRFSDQGCQKGSPTTLADITQVTPKHNELIPTAYLGHRLENGSDIGHQFVMSCQRISDTGRFLFYNLLKKKTLYKFTNNYKCFCYQIIWLKNFPDFCSIYSIFQYLVNLK